MSCHTSCYASCSEHHQPKTGVNGEKKMKKSLRSNSLRMWLASASLHCEMQLNSPGAINGLLIQTRPGGGAAPSPTGRSGVLVALPFLLWLFFLVLISGWCWDNQKKRRARAASPKASCRNAQARHRLQSTRQGSRGPFSLFSHTCISCFCLLPNRSAAYPVLWPIPRTHAPLGWRFGDAHAASCMALHALGAAHTVNGGAIAQTRGARLPWQLRACCRSASSFPSLPIQGLATP